MTLEFDQPVAWNPAAVKEFWLDGQQTVASGAAVGNTLALKLAGPSSAKAVTYVDSKAWSQDRLLRGANGIAAFSFCGVPIEAPAR